MTRVRRFGRSHPLAGELVLAGLGVAIAIAFVLLAPEAWFCEVTLCAVGSG